MSLDGFYAGRKQTNMHDWMNGTEAAGFMRVTRWVIDAPAWRERLGYAGGEQSVNSEIIAPPERIALLHGESPGDPNAFESVLTFAPDGAATRIEMRAVFPTKELRDAAVEKYHAIEGGQQTLSKLAAHVSEIVRKGAEG
jgi:uncharacterized protein YndB with AHSA1/START domain